MMKYISLTSEERERITQQHAIIDALAHELPISYADIQKLEPKLFNSEVHAHIISTTKELYSSPRIEQPRASDIACELIKSLVNSGHTEENAKKEADLFEFLSDRKQVPSLVMVSRALNAFSINTATHDTAIEDFADIIPNIFDYRSIDITNPHGALGLFATQLKLSANRRLDESYIHAGLHCLSAIAIKKNIKGYKGCKLNLITLLIAPTAAGKEHGQAFFADWMAELNLEHMLFGKPRTDKDMILNLLEGRGKAIYRVDEAHGLFNSMNNKKADSCVQNMSCELLNMATTNNFSLSGLHRRELTEKYTKLQASLSAKIEKTKENIETSKDGETKSKLEEQLVNAERDILVYEWILEAIKHGIKNPLVNLFMASTPENVDKFINYDAIFSGLIGRCLVLRASEKRAKLQDNIEIDWHPLFQLLSDAAKGTGVIQITDEAETLLSEIRNRLEEDDLRNHSELGALYARKYERIITLASLLAVTTGVINAQDIMYALALSMRHIEDCYYLLKQNNASYSGDSDDLYEAIKLRILKLVGDAGGLGIAKSKLKQNVIRNRAFKAFERQQKVKNINVFDEALSQLIMCDAIKQDGARLHII